MQENNQWDNNNQSNNQWGYNDQTQAGQPIPSTSSFWGNLPPPLVPFQGNYPLPPSTGQFQYQPPSPPQKRNALQWYKQQKKSAKIGIGCGTILLTLMLCMCSLVGYAGAHPAQLVKVAPIATIDPTNVAYVATSQPTHQTVKPIGTVKPTNTQVSTTFSTPIPTSIPTTVSTSVGTDVPTTVPTSVPTQAPTPVPTDIPTTVPTSVPTQAPTPVPTQAPQPTGVNGNPWGYDFNAGNTITNPPATFCNYFACIASFWNGNGYVEECQDGMYSLSGGISGSCSRHGGNLQTLYSH